MQPWCQKIVSARSTVRAWSVRAAATPSLRVSIPKAKRHCSRPRPGSAWNDVVRIDSHPRAEPRVPPSHSFLTLPSATGRGHKHPHRAAVQVAGFRDRLSARATPEDLSLYSGQDNVEESGVDYSFYQDMRPEDVKVGFLWRERLKPCVGHLEPGEREKVEQGLLRAFDAHKGQSRMSGEPFVAHPVEVARILGDLRLDCDTLIAGLLHDTVEDTDYWSFEEIEKQFGGSVRRIVEGETRFSKIAYVQPGGDDAKSLDFQHFFRAMTEDVRIILVKLADRLHNMRTLNSMDHEKQKKKAREVLNYFAPLALMLGLESMSGELEDLALKYLEPEKYWELKSALKVVEAEINSSMQAPRESLESLLQNCSYLKSQVRGIDVTVQRISIHKLYQKLVETGWDLEKNSNLDWGLHLRVILHEREGPAYVGKGICYHVLGLIHQLWTPIPQTLKDFVYSPISTRNQGLETMVWPKSPGKRLVKPLEVHIRTASMCPSYGPITSRINQNGNVPDCQEPLDTKQTSSQGIPTANGVHVPGGRTVNGRSPRNSNWIDKARSFIFRNGSNNGSGSGMKANTSVVGMAPQDVGFVGAQQWLEYIKKCQAEIGRDMSASDFVECMKDDFLVDSVYVFTPTGEVVRLPAGATTLDFAYHVQTDLGHHTSVCKVNGRYVPQHYQLQNAEVVEIFTCDSTHDERFLEMLRGRVAVVQTKSAKQKLQSFLATLEDELRTKEPGYKNQQLFPPGIAELSTFWIDVECEDRPGMLSEVSRLITSHNMSIEDAPFQN